MSNVLYQPVYASGPFSRIWFVVQDGRLQIARLRSGRLSPMGELVKTTHGELSHRTHRFD